MTFSTQASNIYLLSSFDFFVLTVLVFVSFLLNRLNSSAWRLHRSCKFKAKQGGSNLRANFTCLHLLRSRNNCWRQTKANFNVSMPLSKEILVQYNRCCSYHVQMFCRWFGWDKCLERPSMFIEIHHCRSVLWQKPRMERKGLWAVQNENWSHRELFIAKWKRSRFFPKIIHPWGLDKYLVHL